MSFSVDHYPEPLSKRPDLAHDPSNLHAAHLVHNEQAGNREEAPEVGATSRTW